MPSKFDVVVVGSGPAGGSAARVAAENGKRVLVIERSRGGSAGAYRVKPCGGGLGPALLRAVPGLGAAAVHWTTRAANYFEDQLKLTIDVRIGMCHRNELDYAIAENAMRAGAEYAFKSSVIDIDLGRKRVKTSMGSTVEYDWLVGAAGAACPVARAVRHEKKCVPLIVGKVDGDAGSSVAELFFYDGFVGYGWNFPKRDFLDVGIGGDAAGSVVKSMLERLLHKRGWTLYDRQAWQIPWDIPRAPRADRYCDAARRVILVGDSAGFVNFMTGEGITYAVRSGLEAGAVIIGRLAPGDYPTFMPHLMRLLRVRDALLKQKMVDAFGAIFGGDEARVREMVRFLFEERPPPTDLTMTEEQRLAKWRELAGEAA